VGSGVAVIIGAVVVIGKVGVVIAELVATFFVFNFLLFFFLL